MDIFLAASDTIGTASNLITILASLVAAISFIVGSLVYAKVTIKSSQDRQESLRVEIEEMRKALLVVSILSEKVSQLAVSFDRFHLFAEQMRKDHQDLRIEVALLSRHINPSPHERRTPRSTEES